MKRRTLAALAALLLAVTVGLSSCELSLERLTNGGAVPAPSAEYTGIQDGFRYTKTTLTGQEQYLYDQLLAGLKDQAETIDGLYPDNDMIQKAIDAIDRDYPELFWFSGTGQIETTLLGERAMEAVYRPTYAMDAAQRAETQAKIDQQVVALVKQQHEKALKLLTDNRAKLDELAQYLYQKETITGEEFMEILNK